MHRVLCGVELAPATVDQDQIGQVGELALPGILPGVAARTPFLQAVGQAAGNDLVHGGEVVRALHGLDAVDAVLVVPGHAVDHHHLAAHREHALGVGDVVALDAPGRVHQPQHLPKLLARAHGALPAVRGALVQLLGKVAGVLQRHAHQLQLLTAHRREQVGAPAVQLGQQLLDHALFRGIGGEQDFRGRQVLRRVVLQDELGDDLARLLVARTLQREVLRANQPPGADVEHLHQRVRVALEHRDHVPVVLGGGDGLLLLHHALHGADAVAVERSALVVHLGGGLAHAGSQLVDHRGVLSVQEVDHRPKLRSVVLLADQPRAGSQALADLVVHAGPSGLVRVDGGGAVADGEHRAHHVQHLAHHRCALVGAEVLRAVLGLLAHQLRLGEVLAKVDADVGVVLVVLEQDVVVGAVHLDEVALQREGLHLAVHQHDVEVVHLLHHGAHLGGVAAGGVEVLGHPVLQVLGLAHVDDPAAGLHQIAARRIR